MTPPPPSPPRGAQIEEDPTDYEEFEDFSSLPDTRSIASDDSFYPFEDEEEQGVENAESVPEGVPEAASLLRAACANDVGLLRALVRRGVSVEEAQETDRNGRSPHCPCSPPPHHIPTSSQVLALDWSLGHSAAPRSAFSWTFGSAPLRPRLGVLPGAV
ncbi:Ankyrin repeat domain-containing protein 33B [Saguinus oedipus]|uniref:Ankyrin repeat domain-containing protein 33B n=1 Tax=Saguinus oedipus TaxID=9490 RepID=A0ABQ9W9Y3_SAGOE|nr:Ankyrin repeat domain-containing protein 33B [Saguinus oedipus]